jgi:hypothetical protein
MIVTFQFSAFLSLTLVTVTGTTFAVHENVTGLLNLLFYRSVLTSRAGLWATTT